MTQPRRSSASQRRSRTRRTDETGPLRALIVQRDAAAAETLRLVLEAQGVECETARWAAAAMVRTDLPTFDLLIIEHNGAALSTVRERLNEVLSSCRLIVTGAEATYDAALRAMHCGACEYLAKPFEDADVKTQAGADHVANPPGSSPQSLAARLQRVVDLARADRRRAERLRRLVRTCRRLSAARLEVTNQVDSLCNDLVHAYQELADQISHVTGVTEFAAVIRQELDVEELLRTTLEYFLRKFGPMNAAVFMPAIGDDYTLGAYINYDCPKDAATFLLDHLADVIPPLMRRETALRELTGSEELHGWMGDDAEWLCDSHLLAFACHHEGDCLAIFTMWRDAQRPFDRETVTLLSSLAHVFGRQLAHVVHVHHRHFPDEPDWRETWESDDDAGGLAI